MTSIAKPNYIRHINAFFALVQKDDRLRANHISLYMALFQVWNQHHFPTAFPILRDEMLSLCRIGSKNTYTRCLKELQDYKYIVYAPSKHPYAASLISIVSLEIIAPKSPLLEGVVSPKNDTQSCSDLRHGHAQNWDTIMLKIGTQSGSKLGHIYNKQITVVRLK